MSTANAIVLVSTLVVGFVDGAIRVLAIMVLLRLYAALIGKHPIRVSGATTVIIKSGSAEG